MNESSERTETNDMIESTYSTTITVFGTRNFGLGIGYRFTLRAWW